MLFAPLLLTVVALRTIRRIIPELFRWYAVRLWRWRVGALQTI
jgi:hypothetical protein